MSSNATSHYKSNLRDVNFNLFEFLKVGETVLGKGVFSNLDEATARDTLEQVERIATNELAASFAEGDRVPLKFDGEGNVVLPEGITKSLKAWYEGGWNLLELPEHLGGMGAPPSLAWAASEFVAGANPPVAFYQFGGFMSRIIDKLGTPKQKSLYVDNIIQRHWGATMVLTEPDAGSDVGAGRTKARHIKDDIWEIEGVKRFITNGDFDLPENIVHLVLARPEGAAPGTKGLSLFIVPKYWVNDDGSLGERNGAYCTNVEKKMGIKASATCEMTFGEKIPCRGLLMGEVHDGIRQMFMVIEQARMFIGVKSMATLSTAYLNALEFAKERVQGPDLLRIMEKTSPRVRIIQHPDVRRMLMMQKSHAEGMRALIMYGANLQDQIELSGGHGASKELDARNDLFLPLIKGYSSEKGYELLSLSLQTYGGSGYLLDYPIEQYVRDQKIDSLYEGTTAIQALDLIFRKIARDGGATLTGLLMDVRKTIDEAEGGEALAAERAMLEKTLGHMQALFGAVLGKMGESLYHVGLHGNRILMCLAETVIAWLLIRHAALASQKLSAGGLSDADKAFYEGKVASARFFCAEVLPRIGSDRRVIESSSLAIMEMSEDAF